jgi:hypothetical protein
LPWQRLGRVYCPDGTKPWARSHAALPVPVQIEANVYRIFFSTRDDAKRSHVAWVDVDLTSKPRVLREASEPTLAPGVEGTFDDSGIGIGCMTEADDGVRLYYMGWNLGGRTPWRNSIGLALARSPTDLFERFSAGPILDRSPEDPYTLTYPCVVRRSARDWWMWYGSNLTPNTADERIRHVIKIARSHDGIHWDRSYHTAIGFAAPAEYVIVRPTVVKIGNTLFMCFASRGEQYQIGAARSEDYEHWTRIDAVMGLRPSNFGWDSEMTCYPALFLHRDQLWLVYNGNGYGGTGFGLAVWNGDIP